MEGQGCRKGVNARVENSARQPELRSQQHPTHTFTQTSKE